MTKLGIAERHRKVETPMGNGTNFSCNDTTESKPKFAPTWIHDFSFNGELPITEVAARPCHSYAGAIKRKSRRKMERENVDYENLGG